jgi:hypothetical protein
MDLWRKTAAVLITVYLLLYALDALYTFGLTHNQNIKATNIRLAPKNAPLLFHGPCEPLWMISPAHIERNTGIRSYNLALSHSDFADNYLHLYLYLKTNSAPEVLFLYVTPESVDRRFNTFNTFRFAPYLKDDEVAKVVRESDPEYYRWSFIPFMRYAYYNRRVNFEMLQGLVHFFRNRNDAYYPDGFEPPARRVWGNHHGSFVSLYKDSTIFSADSLQVKYMLKTIRLAKSRGTRVYLYESPVLKEAYRYQPNRMETIALIDKLAKQENIPFIRFDNMEIAGSRENYISTLSLNMRGLKIFNDSLSNYLKEHIFKK